jgi:hypothetical protein
VSEVLVPTARTTLSKVDFAAALLSTWPDATKEEAGVLWAHFAGETASGQDCFNWNLGNVKHVKGDGHDYVALAGVWEGVTPDRVEGLLGSGEWTIDPSSDHAAAVGPGKVALRATPQNPASWFRAYPSAIAGMTEFVESKETGRWASVWGFVLAGDPDGYARELGRLEYYTASPDRYAANMRARFAEWMASTAFEDASAHAVDPSEGP